MRPLLAALIGLVSLVVPVLPAVTASAPASADDAPARLRPAGQWYVDGRGRAVVTHGLNMVYKRPPYAPDEVGFGRDDARFLARNGFTSVRLGLIWRAVEPRPGRYDDDYLARIRRTARILADEGIWVLLDFHQDLFHERFQGEGAPTWAVQDDGLPSEPKAGFPTNYFVNLALNRAFDHFWANDPGPGGVGLQDRYAAAWRHVATFFEGERRILGFDLFNEPWPGTGWELCANPAGCPEFDGRLEAMTQRAVDAIRRTDRRTPVLYEPNVIFNNGADTHVTPRGRRLGFSFHDYCLTAEADAEGVGTLACDSFDDLVFENATDHAAETGHAPLLTEFGATTDRATLTGMVDRAAEHRVGWQFWAYCGCDDPTTTGPGAEQALVHDPAKRPVGDNVDRGKLRALVVPHPLAVAGTPLGWRHDRASKVFTARWSTARPAGPGRFRAGARSVLSVPPRVYRHGVRVRARGARVVAVRERVVVLAQRAGATRVRVRVAPR